MPTFLITDPKHWREREKEARDLAKRMDMEDPIAQRAMLAIAEGYAILAKRA